MAIEIYDWADLNDVRNNLSEEFILMNDLDENTDGYNIYASSSANSGKGWLPIGDWLNRFSGTFDGNGKEIRDLIINRPDEEGGLFLLIEGGTIKRLGIIGDVYVTATGGILAALAEECLITKCYTKGRIKGNFNNGDLSGEFVIGGLIGGILNDMIDCYSWAEVEVEDNLSAPDKSGYAGGLVGFSQGAIENCYSVGKITPKNSISGGLIGENQGYITNCYWDKETSEMETSSGGEGKTTEQMKTQETFNNWNFSTIWKMKGYPVFRTPKTPIDPNEPLPNWANLHWLAQYKNIYYEDFHDEDFKDELTTAVWGDDAEL